MAHHLSFVITSAVQLKGHTQEHSLQGWTQLQVPQSTLWLQVWRLLINLYKWLTDTEASQRALKKLYWHACFRYLHDGAPAIGGSVQTPVPTIPCRDGKECKFVNMPGGCRWHFSVKSGWIQFWFNSGSSMMGLWQELLRRATPPVTAIVVVGELFAYLSPYTEFDFQCGTLCQGLPYLYWCSSRCNGNIFCVQSNASWICWTAKWRGTHS